jgi:hypothetical protein
MSLEPHASRQLLREDDSLLRKIFLDVLRHHHPNLAVRIDEIYEHATKWCTSSSEEDFTQLEGYLQQLKPEETILVRMGPHPSAPHAAYCWLRSKCVP